MTPREIITAEEHLATVLLPQLNGRVFHVTSRPNVPLIMEAGALLPNTAGRFTSAFGRRSNGFFQQRGCVSVFDYRDTTRIEDSLSRCSPWAPLEWWPDGFAIFVLSPALYDSLESTQVWHQLRAYHQMVVPGVEAGHPGAISLSSVQEIIVVSILPR